MNYRDYDRKKIGNYQSVGKFGLIYAHEILTGFNMCPEYHEISEQEFYDYEQWKDDLRKTAAVCNRPVLCSGRLGYAEIYCATDREVVNE